MGRSSAELVDDAMRVTAARDEPWRHLAHDGQQERVSVTSAAPPSHSPPIAAQPLVHEVRLGVAEVEQHTCQHIQRHRARV